MEAYGGKGSSEPLVDKEFSDLSADEESSTSSQREKSCLDYVALGFRVFASHYGFLICYTGTCSTVTWLAAVKLGMGGELGTPDSLERHAILAAFGFVLMILVDTLYSNGELCGNYFNWDSMYAGLGGKLVLASRCVIAMVGMPFAWASGYNILAMFVGVNSYDISLYGTDEVLLKDSLLLAGGLFGMMITRTFFISAFVPIVQGGTCESLYQPFEPVMPAHSIVYHTLYSITATISVLAQTAFWLGLNNFMLNYSDTSSLKLLVYVALGFAVYIATGTVQARAYIQVDGIPVPGMDPLPFGLKAIVLALVSHFAHYGHLVAVWELLGRHGFKESGLRDVSYAVTGILLILASRTLRAHSGVGYDSLITKSTDEWDFETPRHPPSGAKWDFQSPRSTRARSPRGELGFIDSNQPLTELEMK